MYCTCTVVYVQYLNISLQYPWAGLLLLPQINYIASILTPPDNVLTRLNDTMEKFVVGGLNIGKSKLYSPIKEGGVGMLNLSDFIAALQCS